MTPLGRRYCVGKMPIGRCQQVGHNSTWIESGKCGVKVETFSFERGNWDGG